jgi:hypothetical protein
LAFQNSKNMLDVIYFNHNVSVFLTCRIQLIDKTVKLYKIIRKNKKIKHLIVEKSIVFFRKFPNITNKWVFYVMYGL